MEVDSQRFQEITSYVWMESSRVATFRPFGQVHSKLLVHSFFFGSRYVFTSILIASSHMLL